MKKIIFILFILFAQELRCQVGLSIKTLEVSDIKIFIPKNLLIGVKDMSPSLNIKVVFKNKEDSTISLFTSGTHYSLVFYYKEKKYINNSIFVMAENVELNADGNLEISFWCTDFLWGTDLYKDISKTRIIDNDFIIDYTKEMMEILPTVRIIYEDYKQKLYLQTTEINNVNINWN